MTEKYPLACVGDLDSDARKWYEAEQCWNCEPEELRKMQIHKKVSARKWFKKLF